MSVKANYIRIPPGAKNHQIDVERANELVEYELLEIERWKTKSELVGLSTAWEYYFNRLRPNSYQQNRTPYQRMRKVGIQSITVESLCHWRVTILDQLGSHKKDSLNYQCVNHVCPSVSCLLINPCK